ncbi:hypothetical protein ACPUVO_15260 [Pseudocolwellia sp. HL-MZ19]|uniref:hypothetical protein n=1 Tax=unclassified Pseudocolwellia TaxID=2848178 RepID=UPI003CF6320B
MKSDELITLLSKSGAEDLTSSLQWINPLPDDATELLKKINIALSIVQFSQSRRAEEKGSTSSNTHFDALTRLKAEAQSILDKQ